MKLGRLAAKKNWIRNRSKENLARARTHRLTMASLTLLVSLSFPSLNQAQIPVYEVTPVESTIKFGVDSSIPIKGTFEKWNASIKLSSMDVRSAVLEIEIQAS